MEKLASCRVCNTISENKKLIAKDYFLGTKKDYDYEICSNCGSLFLVKIPDELTELYKNYYSFSPPKPISALKRWIYKNLIKKRNVFNKVLLSFLNEQDDLPFKSLEPIKLTSDDHILDVGCGSGALLAMLCEMGFKKCMGIDPFLDCSKEFSSGLVLKKAEFFDLQQKFDLIMFHHVFEHFPEIKGALKHVHSLLNESFGSLE